MTETTETAPVGGTEGADAPEVETTAATPADTQETEQTDAEPEDKSEEEGEKPAKQPWFQKRIAQLTARAAAQEAELAALRAKAEGKAVDPADIDRIAEQRAAEIVKQREFLAATERTANKGAEAFPDWEETRLALVQNFGQEIAARPDFLEAITDLDHGHAVFHHLGKNPEEADRILSLPPAKMAIALAKLEAKISAKPETKPVAVSKAAKPPKHIQVAAVPEVDPEKLSGRDWVRWREAQIAQKKR